MGTISGSVKSSQATSLTGIQVHLYSWNGSSVTWLRSTLSQDGAYSLANVPVGTYKLRFIDSLHAYTDDWYVHSINSGGAAIVTVNAGKTTSANMQMTAQ